MNKVLFKVDDFLFDGWNTNKPVDDNWSKFWDIIEKFEDVKINLGIVGSRLEGHDPKIIQTIKDNLGTKIELFNHSFSHGDDPAQAFDMIYNRSKIEDFFGVFNNIYGAPRNDISKLGKLEGILFTRDIPINGYRELENVIPGSFVQSGNFMEKYQEEHEGVKVYQMHPPVWDDEDRRVFELILNIMVADKEWIFTSEYAR